jgi:hypothetical protein
MDCVALETEMSERVIHEDMMQGKETNCLSLQRGHIAFFSFSFILIL